MSKAPDKIYIEHEYTDNTTLPCGVNWENRTNDNDTCYIRKDALLEWAKEQEENLVGDSFTTFGKRKLLERLIDKLNSM